MKLTTFTKYQHWYLLFPLSFDTYYSTSIIYQGLFQAHKKRDWYLLFAHVRNQIKNWLAQDKAYARAEEKVEAIATELDS